MCTNVLLIITLHYDCKLYVFADNGHNSYNDKAVEVKISVL